MQNDIVTPQTVWSVKTTKKTARGVWEGDIYERDSVVGTFKRAANCGGYISDIKFKWYSERARDRFCGFCDCLSAEETVHAISDV